MVSQPGNFKLGALGYEGKEGIALRLLTLPLSFDDGDREQVAAVCEVVKGHFDAD